MKLLKFLLFGMALVAASSIAAASVLRKRVPAFGGEGVDGIHVYVPDGTRIGQILMPESCANLCFVGKRRNRLFICGSQSVYTIYTAATGAHIT